MAKRRVNDKTPVKLRRKRLINGNISLYLDIYSDGQRKREFLKLYLVAEKSAKAREQNKKTLEIAETIKAERLLNIQASKSEYYNTDNKALRIPFADFMANEIDKMKAIRSLNHIRRYKSIETWVRKYDSVTTLGDINKQWIQGFIHFLNVTPGKYSKKLSQNTINEYLIYIANVLNNAVREGIIPENPTKKLTTADKPKKYESNRPFLTQEEIKKLIAVPSPPKYNNIRNAFLFSCFCGLRYSDIKQLRWEHLTAQQEMVFLDKNIQKTQERLYLPLSKRALSFLPERSNGEDLVFNLPKSMATVEMYIKLWSEFAQIDKHITFHTARHTFAVSILTCGGDIYTLSKLLGHKRVTTTQIYADIIEDTKKKTMNLLDDFGV